jgi:hypothetical protein
MQILVKSTTCLIIGFDENQEPLNKGVEITLVKVGEKAYAKVGKYFLREKILESLKRRIQIVERQEKPDVAQPSLKLNVSVDFKFFMSEQFSGIITEIFEYGVEFKLVDKTGKVGEGIYYMTYAELKARLAQTLIAKFATCFSTVAENGSVDLNLSKQFFDEMLHLHNNLFD